MKSSTSRDRRLFKGAIIGAAGVAVLVGGGTFAIWFDSADLTGGEINSGQLLLDAGTGTWYPGATGGTAIGDIASYLISPGDVVRLEQPLSITAIGDHLEAELTLDLADIAGTNELADAIEVSTTLGGADAGDLTADGANRWTIVGDEGPARSVTLTVVFTLPSTVGGEPGTGDGVEAQNQSITLDDIHFELTQINA